MVISTPPDERALTTVNTSAGSDLTLRTRVRRAGRLVRAALPTGVWFGAIAAALLLYWRNALPLSAPGLAEDQQYLLTHAEPDAVRGVHVALFDPVRAGQLLVNLDDSEERVLLAQAEQDLERLRAEVPAEALRWQVAEARATLDAEDIAREFAAEREARRIDYLVQLAIDARDRVLLRSAEVEAEIVQALHAEGNAGIRELNEIDTLMDSLRATLAANEEVLQRKREAYAAADERWSKSRGEVVAGTDYEAVLAPLRKAVDVRERDIENLRLRLERHVLRSPIDGQVVALAVRPGAVVQPNTALVTIAPVATRRVVAFLTDTELRGVEPGTPVMVQRARSREVLRGEVSAIASAVTQAPQRLWSWPNAPSWGRGIVVTLGGQDGLMCGEMVNVRVERGRLW